MGTWNSVDDVVKEITRTHRSLPPRPDILEVEAAEAVVRNVDEDQSRRIAEISKQNKGASVPDELFFLFVAMQENLVLYHNKQKKMESVQVIELEEIHRVFDGYVTRALRCVPGTAEYEEESSAMTMVMSRGESSAMTVDMGSSSLERQSRSYTTDDLDLKMVSKKIGGLSLLPRAQPSTTLTAQPGEDSEKLSLIKLANLIEVSSKDMVTNLNLKGKLSEKIDWLPNTLNKLSSLVTLDLSDNQLRTLPDTIGQMSSITKLDLSCNDLLALPETIGGLTSLVTMDLHGNQLSSLPATIGNLTRLESLDLSNNELSYLPDTFGNLVRLRMLIIDSNKLEELPYTIGNCCSLVELRVDRNHLKALPEAIGSLTQLEILSAYYNNLKGLPTSMNFMEKLIKLNVSFNEIDLVPETLCRATNLTELNLAGNFANLVVLPRCIGDLELLEQLDISDSQIKYLPDSFGLLTKLRVFKAENVPLEVPPRHMVSLGAQAVVESMKEYVAQKNVRSVSGNQKISWCRIFVRLIKGCYGVNKDKHDLS